jgi:hypothetical protein
MSTMTRSTTDPVSSPATAAWQSVISGTVVRIS